jgi:hypothetical protein
MARPHRRNIPQIVTSNSAFGLGDVEQVEHIVRVPVVENEALEARADSSASLRDADNLATVDDCLAGTDRTEADQPTPSRALQRPSMHGGVDTEAAERTCPCLAEPMAGQAVVAPATVGSRQQDVEPEAPPVRDQHGSPPLRRRTTSTPAAAATCKEAVSGFCELPSTRALRDGSNAQT